MDGNRLKVLLTGGAGFIGSWVARTLLGVSPARRVQGPEVDLWILDNLCNGRRENLEDLEGHPGLQEVVIGDIKDRSLLRELFRNSFHLCFHLAASINVQDSIDQPRQTFDNDVLGTFNVLEECRAGGTKLVFMSTCMVYDRCLDGAGIDENHPVKPASPYAGSKIAGEHMVLSYHFAYGLPVVVIRPFNTYGPMQKTNGEGGVVAVFIQRSLDGRSLEIFGDGTQTRDLLYVSDCAEFVVRCGFNSAADGQIINAGLGEDVSINRLAAMIEPRPERIVHVPHIHPQSEIMKLKCNYAKARRLLGWRPTVSLEEGLRRTRQWIEKGVL